MLRGMAYVFAVIFIAIGVAGFLDMTMQDGKLLGIFAVNNAHNLVHIGAGVLAGIAGYLGASWSRIYFQVFGIVYLGLAAAGVYHGEGMLFGYIANNFSDVALHAVVGVAALYLGFCCGCSSCKQD